jgi:hypothetical protein
MTEFFKDFLAVMALGGFTVCALGWMDVFTRLM